MKERCLVLIKPDALEKRLTGVILDRLERLELDVIAAKYIIAFQPVSFHTFAKATIGQKYFSCAKKLIG